MIMSLVSSEKKKIWLIFKKNIGIINNFYWVGQCAYYETILFACSVGTVFDEITI